jgi:hypothetical protein
MYFPGCFLTVRERAGSEKFPTFLETIWCAGLPGIFVAKVRRQIMVKPVNPPRKTVRGVALFSKSS